MAVDAASAIAGVDLVAEHPGPALIPLARLSIPIHPPERSTHELTRVLQRDRICPGSIFKSHWIQKRAGRRGSLGSPVNGVWRLSSPENLSLADWAVVLRRRLTDARAADRLIAMRFPREHVPATCCRAKNLAPAVTSYTLGPIPTLMVFADSLPPTASPAALFIRRVSSIRDAACSVPTMLDSAPSSPQSIAYSQRR